MATHTWKTGVSGLFTTSADWQDGVAPKPGDTGVIASGTVTVATLLQGETIQLQSGIAASGQAYTDRLILAGATLDANSGLYATGFNARDAARHVIPFTVATAGTVVNNGIIDVGGDSFLSGLTMALTQTDVPRGTGPSIVNGGQVVVYGDSTLTIGSSAAAVTVENDGTMDALASSTLVLSDAPASLGTHNTIVNNGTILIGDTTGHATGTIAATLTGSGQAIANGDGSVLTISGAAIGAGVVAQNGGTVAYTGLSNGLVQGGAFAFNQNGTLDLDLRNAGSFDPNIVNFTAGDVIRVHTATQVTGMNWDLVNGELNLTDSGGNVVTSLFIVGLYQQSDFSTPPGPVIPFGPGYEYDIQTDVVGTIGATPCFMTGTPIETDAGPVPVEAIGVGDALVTADGRHAPVRWVGRRQVTCKAHPKPAEVRPVRVSAGAFGEGQPRRDVWLSPDHAVAFEDVLIPVKYLVDGHGVTQVPLPVVTYHHVELERHDIVLAAGLAVESFLDTGQKDSFDGGPTMRLHPDFSARVWEADGCRPLHIAGPVVERARARLLAVRRGKRAA